MRFANRNSIDPPASITEEGNIGDRERKRALAYFSAKSDAKVEESDDNEAEAKIKKFIFSAYAEDDVKEALEKLFHNKCAYCESGYKAVISVQVEHFRPKGRVAEDPQHTGYWWLASSWSNLLPSCVHCNGTEFHQVFTFETEAPYGISKGESNFKTGKYDFFPIGGERANSEVDDLELEDAYLIDPTKRNPEDHLRWIVHEGMSLVAPVKNGENWDPYGFYTYRIFGLNRRALAEARTSLMLKIEAEIADIRSYLIEIAEWAPGRNRDFMIDKIFKRIGALEEFTKPSSEYSMMAKSILDGALAELIDEFESVNKNEKL